MASLCSALRELSVTKATPRQPVPVESLRHVIASEKEKGETKEEKIEEVSAKDDSAEMSGAQRQHYTHLVSKCNVLKRELREAQLNSRRAAMLDVSYRQTIALLQEHCMFACEQRNVAVSRLSEARSEAGQLKEKVRELERERDVARKERDEAKMELQGAADEQNLLRENLKLKEDLSMVEAEKEEVSVLFVLLLLQVISCAPGNCSLPSP